MSRIVVIENDSAIRALICEWLVADGHSTQAWAAVDTEMTCQADVAIVGIADLRSCTAQELNEVRRWCVNPILIGMSGQLARSFSAESELARAFGVSRLIAKPCTRDEVLAAVTAAARARA